jgi:hypothetical protein
VDPNASGLIVAAVVTPLASRLTTAATRTESLNADIWVATSSRFLNALRLAAVFSD